MKPPRGPSGFIAINKPSGITSFDVIRELRRMTGLKKMGHSGVLDKPATGVLVVGINKATRLFELFSSFEKEYTAEIWFGFSTNTDDLTGVLSEVGNGSLPSKEEIESGLGEYLGVIEQIPPAFSLTKKGGKELYRYALAGEKVEVEPKRVTILESNLIHYKSGLDPTQAILPGSKLEPDAPKLPSLTWVKLTLKCVGGVYVRCVARDLGADLGTNGTLGMLTRTRVGPFTIGGSHSLDEIANHLHDQGAFEDLLQPLSTIAPAEQRIPLDAKQLSMVRNGSSIQRFKQDMPPMATKRGDIVYGLDPDNELAVILSVGGIDQHGLVELKPSKVLS